MFYQETYLIASNSVLLIIIFRLVPVSGFYCIYYFSIKPFRMITFNTILLKGKCLSIVTKNKDDQLSTISFVSSNILITPNVGRICNSFEKNRAFHDKNMKLGTWLVDNNTK